MSGILRRGSLRAALLLLATGLFSAPLAQAETQEYLNSLRANSGANLYVLQSVDGEYGKYTVNGKTLLPDGSKQAFTANETWQGYGVTTSLGVELIHFIQLEVGHTLVVTKHAGPGTEAEHMSGSRLHVGTRFAFSSPAGNLEFGAGLTGSRLDFTQGFTAASMYGTGHFYTLGLNYFMSTHISLFGEGKLLSEHLLNNAGDASVATIDAVTSVATVGVKIWL